MKSDEFVAQYCQQPFETCTGPVQQADKLVKGVSEGQLIPQSLVSLSFHPLGRSWTRRLSGWQFAAYSQLGHEELRQFLTKVARHFVVVHGKTNDTVVLPLLFC